MHDKFKNPRQVQTQFNQLLSEFGTVEILEHLAVAASHIAKIDPIAPKFWEKTSELYKLASIYADKIPHPMDYLQLEEFEVKCSSSTGGVQEIVCKS